MGKPWEFWMALFAASLFVMDRHKDLPLVRRVIMVAISAGLGVSLASEAAAWSGVSETLAVVVLVTFGYILLDVASAVFSDRELFRDAVLNFLKRKGG